MAKRIRIEYQDGQTEDLKADTWVATGFMLDFADLGSNVYGPVLSVHHSAVRTIRHVDVRVRGVTSEEEPEGEETEEADDESDD